MTCFARRNRLGLAVVVCSVVIASAACAPGGRSSGGDPFQGSSAGSQSSNRTGEIRIQVENSNFNDAVVHGVRSTSRRRLGRVQGVSDGELRMPWVFGDQLYCEVDLRPRGGCVSRPAFVEPGETLLLVIGSSSRPMCNVRRGR